MGNGILGMSTGLTGGNLIHADEKVDFFIHGYSDTKFTVFGWDIYLTTTHFYLPLSSHPILL